MIFDFFYIKCKNEVTNIFNNTITRNKNKKKNKLLIYI